MAAKDNKDVDSEVTITKLHMHRGHNSLLCLGCYWIMVMRKMLVSSSGVTEMLRKFLIEISLIILESASFSCVLGKRVVFAKFYMLLGVNIARSLLQLVMNWPRALRGVSILNPEPYQAVMYRESLKELRKGEHEGGLREGKGGAGYLGQGEEGAVLQEGGLDHIPGVIKQGNDDTVGEVEEALAVNFFFILSIMQSYF